MLLLLDTDARRLATNREADCQYGIERAPVGSLQLSSEHKSLVAVGVGSTPATRTAAELATLVLRVYERVLAASIRSHACLAAETLKAAEALAFTRAAPTFRAKAA